MPWQTVDARPQKRRKGDAVEDAERRELRLRRTYNEAAAGHATEVPIRVLTHAYERPHMACGGIDPTSQLGGAHSAGVRAAAQQSKLYVGMVLILIFAEALGLYGLIVGLILSSKGGNAVCGE